MNAARRELVADYADWLAREVATEFAATPVVMNRLASHTAALQDAAALLPQAWSEMPIRNLLSDMLRALKKLGANASFAANDDLKDACETLTDVIEADLGRQSPTRARYNSALCLGYKVKTAGSKYSGKADDRADMLKRVDDMKRAIRSAYRLADDMGGHNANPRMLKIFMAPEFFFRGRNGAYDSDTVYGGDGRPGLVQLLGEETDQDHYDDWLFVLGTVILASEWTDEDDEDDVNAQVDNLAIVRKQRQTHFIAKELISRIDYVADRKKGKKNVVKVRGKELPVLKFKDRTGYDGTTAFTDERMGGCVFTIDGITFGLEVCLDHASSTSSKDDGRLRNASNIQIQLVPSAGMDFDAFRTVANGIYFNVDGITPHVHAMTNRAVGGRDDSSGMDPKGLPTRAWASIRRKFGQTVGAPRVACGGSGSVIGLGPYDIPAI